MEYRNSKVGKNLGFLGGRGTYLLDREKRKSSFLPSTWKKKSRYSVNLEKGWRVLEVRSINMALEWGVQLAGEAFIPLANCLFCVFLPAV